MSGLSEADREELWAGMRRISHDDAPVSMLSEGDKTHALWAVAPAVEAIVARHVTAALNEAADAIDQREGELRSLLRRRAALTPDHTRGMAEGCRDAARIVRART